MKFLIKNKHWNITEEYNIDKLLYLLIDRPIKAIKATNNTFIWENKHKQFHRDYDLPAIVGNDNYFAWYCKDIRHRENDKLAIICSDGYKEYWVNGNIIL